MNIYMYICIYIYIYVYIYINAYICVCIYVYTCIYINMFVYIDTHFGIYTYQCMDTGATDAPRARTQGGTPTPSSPPLHNKPVSQQGSQSVRQSFKAVSQGGGGEIRSR